MTKEENVDKEPLSAKLRNKLSPIYGLANIVLLAKENELKDLTKLMIEQADLSLLNVPLIDEILIKFDDLQSENKRLIRAVKMAIRDKYMLSGRELNEVDKHTINGTTLPDRLVKRISEYTSICSIVGNDVWKI